MFCYVLLGISGEKSLAVSRNGKIMIRLGVKNGVQASQAAFYRGFCIFQASQRVRLGRLEKWFLARVLTSQVRHESVAQQETNASRYVVRAWYAGTLGKKALEKSGLNRANVTMEGK